MDIVKEAYEKASTEASVDISKDAIYDLSTLIAEAAGTLACSIAKTEEKKFIGVMSRNCFVSNVLFIAATKILAANIATIPGEIQDKFLGNVDDIPKLVRDLVRGINSEL